MGINLVVITENSKNLSLKGFRDALLQEPLIGKIAWDKHWEEFDWEGKKYFTWILAPRISAFDPYSFKPEAPTYTEITFLKIMLLVERITGGTIYIGNDAVHIEHPNREDEKHGFMFWIPPELDYICKDWRETASKHTEKLGLIF
ncbi:MAG: hypothetical protein H7A23_00720 [Leptospiraceae bacterium]|nr:hypothetical protein [Leptospiraceae bacterium]MCP5493053.1 hypothetical protein [Leptospiraceae bacterium]